MNNQLHNIYYNQALQAIRDLKLEAGKKKLIKAITFDSNQTTTWNLLGLVYYRLGKLKSAQYCWMESLEIDRENNNAVGYIKEYEQETRVIESCLAKLNDLIKTGAFKKAKKIIYEMPEQIANKADILNFFGLIMILSSDVESARTYWLKSLKISIDGMAPNYLAESISQKKSNEIGMNLISYLKRKLRI